MTERLGFYGPKGINEYDTYLIDNILSGITRSANGMPAEFHIMSLNGVEVCIRDYAKMNGIPINTVKVDWSSSKFAIRRAMDTLLTKIDVLHIFTRKDSHSHGQIIASAKDKQIRTVIHDLDEMDEVSSTATDVHTLQNTNTGLLLQGIVISGVTCTPLHGPYDRSRSTPTQIFYDHNVLNFSDGIILKHLERLMKKKWRGSSIIAPGVSPSVFAIMLMACETYSLQPKVITINDPADTGKMWRFLSVAQSTDLFGLGSFLTEMMKGRSINGYLSTTQNRNDVMDSAETVLSVCDHPHLIYTSRGIVQSSPAARFRSIDGPLIEVTFLDRLNQMKASQQREV